MIEANKDADARVGGLSDKWRTLSLAFTKTCPQIISGSTFVPPGREEFVGAAAS